MYLESAIRGRPRRRRVALGLLAAAGMTIAGLTASPSSAHDDDAGGSDDGTEPTAPADPSGALEHSDSNSNVISGGPFADVTKDLALVGRGERNVADATTDVWALDGYAYTGTFNSPCGGTSADAGVWVWDVSNKNKPSKVTVIPSPAGSRSNDVRVATMNSGDILVHSNEPCGGGPGGFEIYDVDDPANPVALASVQTDDVNLFLQANFGFVDFGVHNLWLFSQGTNDYVAATVESLLGNFQIFDITDPANPSLVGFWGAEQSVDAQTIGGVPGGVDWVNTADFAGVILPANSWNTTGFGASANRFLHDVTITADGQHAFLANWDQGLVLLDISDPTNPTEISTAIDIANGSLDGEVNSHSVWPNEDMTIVVEGEEDFDAWEATVPPSNLTLQNLNTIPGVAISTVAGDDFEDPANQTSNAGIVSATSVEVTSGPLAATTYQAVEFGGNNVPLGAGSVSGDLVWVGRACNGDPFVNPLGAGDIAVVRRGACFFSDKEANVAAAGASAMVLANNDPTSTPWSGLRIWDYSDPADPVLASTFDTVCSASTEPSSQCAANGTYSVHNVQVETKGNKVLAYVSWYWDGMLVLDVTDPYDPIEIARYLDTSNPNDGLANDFWGIYKEENSPSFYGSDRNGGLYVFQLKGAGRLN